MKQTKKNELRQAADSRKACRPAVLLGCTAPSHHSRGSKEQTLDWPEPVFLLPAPREMPKLLAGRERTASGDDMTDSQTRGEGPLLKLSPKPESFLETQWPGHVTLCVPDPPCFHNHADVQTMKQKERLRRMETPRTAPDNHLDRTCGDRVAQVLHLSQDLK